MGLLSEFHTSFDPWRGGLPVMCFLCLAHTQMLTLISQLVFLRGPFNDAIVSQDSGSVG